MELSADDRQFFASVVEVIFSNPFDDAALDERLEKLSSAGVATTKDVGARDRELFGYVLLFRVYDRYVDRFDALIAEQLARGDEPAAVTFADALRPDL